MARPPPLKEGASATLHGLVSRPDLNGKEVTLLSFFPRDGRWGVKLADGSEALRTKPSNLIAAVAVADDVERSTLATLNGTSGVVSLWDPHHGRLRKGGNGNPQQPHLMKPQFYTWARQDATHPSGEAVEACALVWLGEESVAVGYVTGDVVAWRVAQDLAEID